MVCATPQATFQTSFDNNASTDLGTFSSPFSPCPSIPVVPSPHMYKSQASKHKQTRLTTWIYHDSQLGSYRFFNPKFETFSRIFSQTWIVNIFPDLRLSNRWSKEALQNWCSNKAFFMMHCKHMGEIEWDLTKMKTILLIKHLL